MNMMQAFATAWRTLTIIPIPFIKFKEENFRKSLFFFPFAGVIITGILYCLYYSLNLMQAFTPLLSGILLACCPALITGFIHIDGLADAADGFGGGKTPEDIIKIFRDPHHGTFGVCAIIFDCLLKSVLFSVYIDYGNFLYIGISIIAARSMQSAALSFMPYTPYSSGIAAAFTGKKYRAGILAVSCLFFIACGYWGSWISLYAICFSFVSGILFLLLCFIKIRGITGDCIGALNEITEVSILLAGVFFLKMRP